MRTLLIVVVLAVVSGCAVGTPPPTVGRVDLGRYAGTWYEIARFDQWFERGCAGVTATYTPREDGTIGVLNVCREGGPGGKVREAKGTARVVDGASNAKLKVMFAWPFEGDYWILRLSEDYSTAAVGSPDRSALWILHRSKAMEAGEYEALVASLRADGFDVGRLVRVRQE